MRLIYF